MQTYRNIRISKALSRLARKRIICPWLVLSLIIHILNLNNIKKAKDSCNGKLKSYLLPISLPNFVLTWSLILRMYFKKTYDTT